MNPPNPYDGYRAKSPHSVPVIFANWIGGTVVGDWDTAQRKLGSQRPYNFCDDGYLDGFAGGKWQLLQVHFTMLIDRSFDSDRFHGVDHTLQLRSAQVGFIRVYKGAGALTLRYGPTHRLGTVSRVNRWGDATALDG